MEDWKERTGDSTRSNHIRRCAVFTMAAIADLNYIGQPHVIFASLLGSVLVYSICLGLYRILFHPLRKIPGLKLAAFTGWLETYYECFKPPGGQFMWEYQKWHETYGT